MPRLTLAGRALLLGSAMLYLLGWSFGYGELLLVATAGIGALIAGLAWARSVPNLHVERSLEPSQRPVGESARVRLALSNPARRASAPVWALDHLVDRQTELLLPRLAPGGTKTVEYALEADRRGVFHVGPLSLNRQDPFGLVRAERQLTGTNTFIVTPKVYAIAPIPSGRLRDLEGPTVDKAEGSITFQSLREYVPGDEPRRIHWRSSARTGTLLVRHQVDSSQPRAVVVLDTTTAAYDTDEAFEAMVSIAASVTVSSVMQRYPVRMITSTGDLLLDRSGQGAGVGAYERLAEVARDARTDLGRAVNEHVGGGRGRSLVVVTGRGVPSVRATVAAQAASCDLTVLIEVDPTEKLEVQVLGPTARRLRVADGPTFVQAWQRTLA